MEKEKLIKGAVEKYTELLLEDKQDLQAEIKAEESNYIISNALEEELNMEYGANKVVIHNNKRIGINNNVRKYWLIEENFECEYQRQITLTLTNNVLKVKEFLCEYKVDRMVN